MTVPPTQPRPIAEADGPTVDVSVLVEAALPPDFDLNQVEPIVRFVLRSERQGGAWSVAVVLTDDERLRALHRDYMGLDSPTDVMTFPYADGEPGAAGERGGDIVVSVERAADQAAAFGLTPAQETIFLIVHGLLHLCGWDDGDDERRAAMLERQRELLAAFAAGSDAGAPQRPSSSVRRERRGHGAGT